MTHRHDNFVVLRSADDPDSLGPSIADSFNLSWGGGMEILQDYTLPHHLVLTATPKSQRPRYFFAYTMIGRAIHNKKDLLRVTLPSPSRSFPFWKLSAEQLQSVKNRLYIELAYEAAQLCMEIFLEVAEQAYRNQEISRDSLDIFSAICSEIPLNRRNFNSELPKIIETSIAECLLWKRNLSTRRDICALFFRYVFNINTIEASQISLNAVTKLLNKPRLYTYCVTVPTRKIYTGDLAGAFLYWYLDASKGSLLFCGKNQLPYCDHISKAFFDRMLSKRLSIICKNVPHESVFYLNFSAKVQEAFDLNIIGIQTRKILFGQLVRRQRLTEQDELLAFYSWLEQDLGVWPTPFRKA